MLVGLKRADLKLKSHISNKSNAYNGSYPGPQKEISRPLSTNRFLFFLVVIAVLLFLQAVAHDNYQRLNITPFWLGSIDIWSIQILDNKSSATIIVGLLGLAFVNRQVVLAYRPFLNYRSQKTSSSTFALRQDANNKGFWGVKLQNIASGPAIVTRSLYRVSKNDEYEGYESVLAKLSEAGLTNGEDFVLRFLSNGWCLAAKDECIIAEFDLQKAMSLSALDIKVEFKGLLGDEYEKQIFCIPRKGIYPQNPHVPVLGSTNLPQSESKLSGNA